VAHVASLRVIAGVVAGLALGCAGVEPVPERALDEEAVRGAAARIEAFDAAHDDVALVEGGLRARVLVVRRDPTPEPYLPYPPARFDRWYPILPPDPPPRDRLELTDRVIAWRNLRGVRVHRWLLGSGIELDVAGESEPLVLRVDDAEAAPLAEALDLLRRAQAPWPPEPPPE
jgi:hypothetical protein